VRRLEEEYASALVVVGVHSGKFIAERETENIRTATRRLEIDHPVVNDRHYRTWRAYSVQAWPTLVLVSPDGKYIGQHAGEITFEMFDPILETLVEVYTQAGLLDPKPLHFPPDPDPAVGTRLIARRASAPLRFPGKVLADSAQNRLFVADTGNNRVLVARLSDDGASAEVVQTIGGGEGGAALHHPEGMALAGNTLYIADTENHSLCAADLELGTLKTIAGTGQLGYERTGTGVGTSVSLNSPWDLLEREGQLYIAMAGTHQIWRMDLPTSATQALVGSGRENIDDGPNPRATLAQPSGLTTDGQRLYFADSESSAVRAADFAPDGYTQTLVGEGLFEFGDRDGKGRDARLQHCLGVSYYAGKIFIADTYNNKIKSLDLSTREVVTVAGSGEPSDMYEPGGLSVWERDGMARLYIADTNNHRVLMCGIGEAGELTAPLPVALER
jgi:DNA-binding beta-propeller fold protein YncE